MKCLLVAINAKYIHSNPGVYSLKAYAEMMAEAGGAQSNGCDLPPVHIEIGEYTINNQMELILEDIYRRKPDVVGISCYIWNITHVLHLVRDLHKVLPDTDIWLGGPEVSFDAVRLLQQEPEVLGIMKGEGEETFAWLMKWYRQGQRERNWEELEQAAGLTCRIPQGGFIDRPIRPVMDMSQIPFLYRNLEGFEHRIVYYESSRGCPFSCSYCLSSIDKSVRFRDLELVRQELDFFLERKIPQVKFVDRTFNCKKSHAMAIWQHIQEHDNGVTNFHFEIAADLLDQEELELIGNMRPGLIQLEIGVQSTNLSTIGEIHRNMDLGELRQVVAQINEGNNVHQHLDLIAGLPHEDYQSFHRSFNDVYKMAPEQLQLGFLKVLKGSYMHDQADGYGLIYREQPPYEVLSTNWISFEEILQLKGIEDMVEVYYNSGQFSRTLKLIESEFEDAFIMFENMAEYYRQNQLTGQNHSRLSRYEILHQWIKLTVTQEKLEQIEDALICDLYGRENAKSRPSFAVDQTTYKERIRSRIPNLRTLGTQIHAEVLHSGELLIFDYREKDPLTNNAKVTKEEDYGKT